MKVTTERKCRDKVAEMLRSKEPVLLTRQGRLAGVFFPLQKNSLPKELKHALFAMLTNETERQIKRRGSAVVKPAAETNAVLAEPSKRPAQAKLGRDIYGGKMNAIRVGHPLCISLSR